MKWPSVVFAALLVLMFSLVASAEYYQYRDKDGAIRFTDDATMIPEDQRSDMIVHESVKSEPAEETLEPQPADLSEEESEAVMEADEPETGEAVENEVETEEGAPPPPPMVQKDKMEKRQEYDELNAMREELQKAYNELEAEKKAVGPPPSPGAKTGEMADYVQKRRELEKKIEAYNQQSEAFDEKVKAFNRTVAQ